MQRGRLLIILGIILGLAVLGAVLFLVLQGGGATPAEETPQPQTGPEAQPTEIATTEIIVALQPIPRGAEFVQGAIGRRAWPIGNIPPNAIADEAETIGKVAKTEIFQGQVIVRDMLTDIAGGDDASFQIPTGRVAIAYPIDSQRSVSYAIRAGDFFDILITAFFQDVDEEFQTRLPNKVQFFFPQLDSETGDPIGFTVSDPAEEGRFVVGAGDLPAIVYPREAQIPRRVAQLTVQAAKVIRLGPWLEEPPPPPPPDQSQEGEPAEGPTPAQVPALPQVVTLAVTPQDALVLLWLRTSGIYSEMALRAAGEENADHLTEAVTLQYMLTRFNIAVPPKIEFIMANIEDLGIVLEEQIIQQTTPGGSQSTNQGSGQN
jgi:Flp pilus assembly protein CpaB